MPRAAAAGLTALALAAAGCGSDGSPSAQERLQSFTGLAQAQVFAYEAGAAVGYAEARRCLEPQQAFVRELRATLEETGHSSPMPPETIREVEGVLPGLAAVRSREDYLRFVGELDSAARAAWATDELARTGLRRPRACLEEFP